VRGVGFDGPDDLFDGDMLAYVERTWDQWLDNLLQELPAFVTVMDALRPQIAAILTV